METTKKTTGLTDAELHRRVIDELKWDTLVDETDVGVQVENGVVTLSGNIKSYAEKQAALNAVHRVIGVRDVANDLVVKLPGDARRTDTEIVRAARRAFEWDPLLQSDDIRLTVTDGWLTLQGTVNTYVQREIAERAVRHLSGVTGVTNQLTVTKVKVDPLKLKDEIESALERQALREASRIGVMVLDGALTLSGTVHSWPEKRAILGLAEHAPGVRSVVDRLTVNPYA